MDTLPRQKLLSGIFLLPLFIMLGSTPSVAQAEETSSITIEHFDTLLSPIPATRTRALTQIDSAWQAGYAPMLLEILSLVREPQVSLAIASVLKARTGQDYGYDATGWYEWIWDQELSLPPYYPEFKSRLYRRLDPKFAKYFSAKRKSTIRLDEVRWGGVAQDGIPPLRNPTMIDASKADYLEDDHIVFGVEVNGDVRAYPKRILAWHEMFTDTVGGQPVTGVYCTLCGAMILYDSAVKDTHYHLGTSGFLYRSNKLMYDAKTQSLWNTLWGSPVIGPLVGKGIRLRRLSVVTTTWGAWKSRHPNTTVLSLTTGHRRDYGEGVAYKEYFATDKLMFTVPRKVHSLALKNKDSVLGLYFPEADGRALAIAHDFLKIHRVYYDTVGGKKIVVVTDSSGAHRVYDAGSSALVGWRDEKLLVDEREHTWSITEAALIGDNGQRLARVPSHSAFWFGWHASFPDTRLVK